MPAAIMNNKFLSRAAIVKVSKDSILENVVIDDIDTLILTLDRKTGIMSDKCGRTYHYSVITPTIGEPWHGESIK